MSKYVFVIQSWFDDNFLGENNSSVPYLQKALQFSSEKKAQAHIEKIALRTPLKVVKIKL